MNQIEAYYSGKMSQRIVLTAYTVSSELPKNEQLITVSEKFN